MATLAENSLLQGTKVLDIYHSNQGIPLGTQNKTDDDDHMLMAESLEDRENTLRKKCLGRKSDYANAETKCKI